MLLWLSAALALGVAAIRAACLPQCSAPVAPPPVPRAERTLPSQPPSLNPATVLASLRGPGEGAACVETGVRAAAGCTVLDLPQPPHRN